MEDITVVSTPRAALELPRGRSKWDVLEKYLAKAIEVANPEDPNNAAGVLFRLGSAKIQNLRSAMKRYVRLFPEYRFELTPDVRNGRELGNWVITAHPLAPMTVDENAMPGAEPALNPQTVSA